MTTSPLEKRTVLIVDDDSNSRESLAELLRSQGYVPSEAENGLLAIGHLLACACPPRFILLDLDMPVMDGREFLSRLLCLKWIVPPTVVVLTGHDPRDVSGAAAVLRKPVSVPRLLALMDRLNVHRPNGQRATN